MAESRRPLEQLMNGRTINDARLTPSVLQLDVRLRGPSLPPDVMKKVVEKFGPDLHGLKERFPGSDFSLNTRYHTISIRGSKEVKQKVEEIVQEVGKTTTCCIPSETVKSETPICPICLCEVENGYRLESCN
nr:ATP-dependent RNA helicase DEAH11, chloroplastic-like [Tanacetum cinerariifolium]